MGPRRALGDALFILRCCTDTIWVRILNGVGDPHRLSLYPYVSLRASHPIFTEST